MTDDQSACLKCEDGHVVSSNLFDCEPSFTDVEKGAATLTTLSVFSLAMVALSSPSNLAGLGPSFFILIHTQILIKTIILIRDMKNDPIKKFLQGGIKFMDEDWFPYDYLPKISVKKQVITPVESD